MRSKIYLLFSSQFSTIGPISFHNTIGTIKSLTPADLTPFLTFDIFRENNRNKSSHENSYKNLSENERILANINKKSMSTAKRLLNPW